MQKLNDSANRILTTVTAGLEVGQARTIDNSRGMYMPVHVDRLAENVYAVAHYYKQNGDRVPDPDMEFLRGRDGNFYPLAIKHSTGHYTRAVTVGESGKPESYAPDAQKELATFANLWMRTICEQQKLRLPDRNHDQDRRREDSPSR